MWLSEGFEIFRAQDPSSVRYVRRRRGVPTLPRRLFLFPARPCTHDQQFGQSAVCSYRAYTLCICAKQNPLRQAEGGFNEDASASGLVTCRSKHAFALQFLASELPRTADSFGFFARPFNGRLFIMLAEFHFTENPLALHFLLQRPKRLIDIVVTNQNLHLRHHLSK